MTLRIPRRTVPSAGSRPPSRPGLALRALADPRRRPRALPVVASAAATALLATLGPSLLPGGTPTADGPPPVSDSLVRAQAELPPRVVAGPVSAPTRASRGAARTAPRATRLVWRTVAVGPTFRGEASWYGPGFQGRRTANGERFDMHALTAAHRTLPFGTRLRVCRGERCVVVRINDRGPFVGDRVLDLSKAAAQRIGYSGTAWVSATPVRQRQVRVPV